MSPKPHKAKHEKDKKTKKKKKRNRSSSPGDAAATLKLLTYAAMGKTRRIRKLLERRSELDVSAYDAEGLTALHHACRFGHLDTAQLLLRKGADMNAEDLAGNSPAHLAATRRHFPLLSVLLQADPPPNIDRRNAKGVTVRSLAASVMDNDDIDDWRSGQPVPPSPEAQASSSADEEPRRDDPEATWRERLAAEAAADGGGGNPFNAGAGWGDPDWSEDAEVDDPGVPWGGVQENEDQFAARIWAEMERRKHAAAAAASASVDAEREAAAETRRKAEADAYQRSQRILEGELARDRAWRDAVKQGDLGVRRARYEARWHAFAAASTAQVVYVAVPWIVDKQDGDIEPIVFYGVPGKEERRKRLRVELMRWHPDKFEARFGRRLAATEKERILDRVKGISQTLNALGAKT